MTKLLAIICILLLPVAVAAETLPDVVVLGVDGMDPDLLQKFMDAGKMPNFKKLIAEGSFSPLQTSIPPQSPVAWSNFITGMDPGGHGVFDFIHRDVQTYLPTFSTALVAAPSKTVTIGSYVIPLSQGKVELLRKGQAFWQILDHCSVPYLVFRIPANFPPVESAGTNVSGMGTPDLLGSYGTFSFYTDDEAFRDLDVSGGAIYMVDVLGDKVEANLIGPENTMRVGNPVLERPFTVNIDRENPVARIRVGDETLIVEQGEWTDWVQVEFDVLGPFNKITGICRFYLKSLSPFQLYVTPINIDPSNAALPISNNAGFPKELFEKIGYYYTQGMPEDTKALEWGVLSDAEFVRQTEIVFRERLAMLDAIMNDYDGGFLFFYFSTIDQSCHMLWRNMDPSHPAHDPATAKYGARIENLYTRIDSVVGDVQSRVPEGTTLIVMSDHGFSPYYKKVNLNRWLYDNGYMKLRRPKEIGRHPLLRNVNWRQTEAYALGINGLFVNKRGREGQGIVNDGEEYDKLLDDITEKLLAYRDPETGAVVVKEVYRTDRVFSGNEMAQAPDLSIGYARGYRGSDSNALGSLTEKVIEPNMDRWSGDHCMAFDVVPGILVANRPLQADDPDLTDLTATILYLYGMEPPAVMKGRQLFDADKLSKR